MMELYAGFDGGGTKTSCVLIDENGHILGRGLGGPSNHLFCGVTSAQNAVRTSLEEAFAEAGMSVQPLRCAFMASAAVELHEGERHVEVYQGCMEAQTLYCDSDVYPLWFAAAGGAPAVISIAGTGAVTYYLNEGEYVKADGWGPDVGDDGSGYALGLRAVRAVLRMADGRLPANKVFMETIYRHYGMESSKQLTKRLREQDKRSAIASAARCIVELYEQDEPLARQMLEDSAEEIMLSIEAVVHRAKLLQPVPLVLSGGLLREKSPLYDLVREKAQMKSLFSSVMAPTVDPAFAAATVALHKSHKTAQALAILYKESRGMR